MTTRTHTPGPFIVRGECFDRPNDPMGAEPRDGEGGGWPYFIRQDREFPLGSCPLWLAHGIQRIEDAHLFAAAADLLEAARFAALALESAAKALRDPFPAGHLPEALEQRAREARAAIAKAEGRSA